MTDIKDNSIQDNSLAASDPGADFVPAPDSPFLRELRAELNRHAEKAVESAAASAQERIRQNADEMEHQRQTASDESFQKWKEEFAKTAGGAIESELDAWRSRLRSEMNLAQAEWSELLQSSLDGSLQRLVEQLSQRSQEVQRSEESRMSERFADLIHPVNDAAAKAGQSLSEIRFGLETQVAAARSSLEEMERSATRIRENSAQFEAAGHDSLNELHRRLENVLDAQTAEMSRRVEAMASGMRREFHRRLKRWVTSKWSERWPRWKRNSRRISSGFLRCCENSTRANCRRKKDCGCIGRGCGRCRRIISAMWRRGWSLLLPKSNAILKLRARRPWRNGMKSWTRAVCELRTRRLKPWAKPQSGFNRRRARGCKCLWSRRLRTRIVGWRQKRPKRLEKFETRITEQANDRVAQVSQNIEWLGDEVAAQTKTRLEAAAETAASSFGEIVRGISNQEMDILGQRSHSAVQERAQEFEKTSTELLRNLEASANASLDQFHAQFGAHFESRIAQGRSALASEFTTAMDGYRAERAAHEQEWSARLNQLSGEAEGKYQERLNNASDSWSVSSVRRLNEHGQNVIESLTRSADQTLRDSFAKIFDGMSEMLRERASASASGAGFPPTPNRDASEQTSSHQ